MEVEGPPPPPVAPNDVPVKDEPMEGVQDAEIDSYIASAVEAPNAQTCRGYEITPVMGVFHGSQVNAIARSANLRWLFTGSEDGFVRMYDLMASLRGEKPLTQPERHPYADTVTKNGILVSAFDVFAYKKENDKFVPENPKERSPIMSLAVHSEAIWCLVGLQSGAINLHSIRHDEGACHHVLRGHTMAVSCLEIHPLQQDRAISGGWDKKLLMWDLNNGTILRQFTGHLYHITSISFQPPPLPLIGPGIRPPPPDSTAPPPPPNDADILPKLEQPKPALPKLEEPNPELPFAPLLLSSSLDGTSYLWTMDKDEPLRKLALKSPTIPWALSSCFGGDGTSVYVGRKTGARGKPLASVDEYSVESGEKLRSIFMPENVVSVNALWALPNRRHLICACSDAIRLYNLSLGPPSPAKPLAAPHPAVKVSPADGPKRKRADDNDDGLPLNDPMGQENVPAEPPVSPTEPGPPGESGKKPRRSVIPFRLIPGHSRSLITRMWVDPDCRFLVTASGLRGWDSVSSGAGASFGGLGSGVGVSTKDCVVFEVKCHN